MLREYLYIDRIRVRSYAEQIGATPTASDHQMLMAILQYLRSENLLMTTRPATAEEAENCASAFVLETMRARKVTFVCNGIPKVPSLREVAVWVSSPIQKPSEIIRSRESIYDAVGMYVYLIEGYWEEDGPFRRAMSMFTALNVVLESLQNVLGASDEELSFKTSRDDFASPVTILERAGGIKGEIRNIETLYRVRAVSDNKIVSVSDTTVRSYDLFGYPFFVAEASKISETGRPTVLPEPKLTPDLEPSRLARREIFVSYAWGDDSTEDARKRGHVVDELRKTLENDGYDIVRDTGAMRPGDLISGFMQRIGRADHVIVVLSEKYLRSTYCMTELHFIYQRSLGEKDEFLRRIIPLVLADARIATWRDRVAYTEYWKAEFKAMEKRLPTLGAESRELYNKTRDWYFRIDDILGFISDKLAPHGFENIVKDDFAALRAMLRGVTQ
jgi:internalin A